MITSNIYCYYRFIPQNESDLNPMYSAMSQGQALHPDPTDEVDDENYMDGEDFDECMYIVFKQPFLTFILH